MHELTRDFRLEDVWALPAEGRLEEFPALVQAIAGGDPAGGSSRAAEALWRIRLRLGAVLGLDDPDSRVGARVPTLRERLPGDLAEATAGPDFGSSLAFSSVYLLPDEWAAELANRTMHGVLHVGWMPVGEDRYRGQLAVLVKPNGALGIAYMAAIRPFRHLIVYPAMMRRIEQIWKRREHAAADARRGDAPG